MPARPALGGREGASERSADAGRPLGGHLRDRGVAVAGRELATALDEMEGLTPAQRRIVALMAGRIAAGVLAPARGAAGDRDPPSASAVERLFASPDEHVREEK